MISESTKTVARATCGVVFGVLMIVTGIAQGSWSPPINWADPFETDTTILKQYRAMHMAMLPNGDILYWGWYSDSFAENEHLRVRIARKGANHSYTVTEPAPNLGTNIFCVGHTFLSDGRFATFGGHWMDGANFRGRVDTDIFNWNLFNPPYHYGWVSGPDMAMPRWYPTAYQTSYDRILIISGTDNDIIVQNPELFVTGLPDVYGTTSFTSQFAGVAQFPVEDKWYPMTFTDPKDGHPFVTTRKRSGGVNRKLNPWTLEWTDYAPFGGVTNTERYWASAVMIDGVIYKTGGNESESDNLPNEDNPAKVAVKTALKVDLNPTDPPTDPVFVGIEDMPRPTAHHTLIPLPDGRFVAMNGTSLGKTQFEDDKLDNPENYRPQIYDPVTENLTERWSLGAAPPDLIVRGYHSAGLLLPSAALLTGGGDEARNQHESRHQRFVQIYTPRYGNQQNGFYDSLDNAPRPVITAAPKTITYGEQFDITVLYQHPKDFKKATLISLGAVTHHMNYNQTFVTLERVTGASGTKLIAPESPNVAPPGRYMLFVIDSGDLPSVAQIVQLKDFTPVFVESQQVGPGISDSAMNLLQTVNPDNSYVGGYFRQGVPNYIDYVVEGKVQSPASVSKLRLRFEHKSEQAGNLYSVWFYDWNAQGYVHAAGLGGVPQADSLVTITTSQVSKYISANGDVRVKIHWYTIDLTDRIYLDWIEFGVL